MTVAKKTKNTQLTVLTTRGDKAPVPQPEILDAITDDDSARENAVLISDASSSQLPATLLDIAGTTDLSHYLRNINQYPLLSAEEEQRLAIRFREHADLQAAHKMVTSHLRLVAKIAFGYRGYRLPVADLISEGNIGLLQAVKNYDHERGARFSTYAIWWIKAAIHEYVLKSWSLVKIGTTSAQKKLFFNLKRLQNKLKTDSGDEYLSEQDVEFIAKNLAVSPKDVRQMESRMVGADHSLNAEIVQGGGEDWQSRLSDERINQEENLIAEDELAYKNVLLAKAMDGLSLREREIIQARKLSEKPKTLEELGAHYGVSRERIRQIETQAMENLKKSMMSAAHHPSLEHHQSQ